MENNSVENEFLRNIGMMLTYKCTIACPHCIVEAGPHRKEEIQLEFAKNWIEQVSGYRKGYIKGLALTGGEPFYNVRNLKDISEFGRRSGLIVSVVTNAFWASTKESALSTLSNLPAIRLLSFSTDVYHQKSIPFDNIINAVSVAKKLRRPYNVAVCTDNEDSPGYKRIIRKLEEMGEKDHVRVSVTYPAGRAKKNQQKFNYYVESDPQTSACSSASSPVIFPDGNVMACIGPLLTLPPTHPMFLGSLHRESLSDILDRAELNPILHIIRAWGPYRLVSLLKENRLDEFLPQKYIHNCICDVCYKLLSNQQVLNALMKILKEEQILKNIAYARLYYFRETTMAEYFHLDKIAEGGP
jgi:MoaA/NifB/PqqE/SkfB family radical SAM enzyme